MSLFGKILAILNVLAALALGYFFLVDFAKRQHWTHAVLRHEVALNGLPLSPEETDREGNKMVDRLPKALLSEVFAGAGNPVASQTEALQEGKQALQAKIDGTTAVSVANPHEPAKKLELRSKVQKLAWALRPLAITAARREGLDRLMVGGDEVAPATLIDVFGTPAADLEKMAPAQRALAVAERLQKELDEAFEQVTAKKEKETADPAEKRRMAAHLLFSLAELAVDEKTEPGKERDLFNHEAYRRALAVVGIEAAAREMDSEAVQMDAISQEIASQMVRDRSLFAQKHAALFARLQTAADDLLERRLELEREKERTQAQQEVLNVRKKQVEELMMKLEERQKATRALLVEQEKMEKALFKAQQEFRDAAKDNHELERDVRTLEKGR